MAPQFGQSEMLRPMRESEVGFVTAAKGVVVLLLGFLVACSSLPTIVPDLSTRSTSAVRLEGAYGPLSARQSKAILTKLKSRGEQTTSFHRHLAIEEAIVGSPLVVGNKVTPLLDGAATYTSMLAAIRGAKDNINMESYIIDDDEIGREFAAALLERQLAGVQVNLVYDSVGAMNTPREYFKSLIDGGINVLEYNPINPLNVRKGWDVVQRDHRKLLVVDGKIAFIGGINISSVYSSGSSTVSAKPAAVSDIPWRDTHLRMEGPVVREFQKLFMTTWEKQNGVPLAPRTYFPQLENKGNEVVRAIGSSPDEPYSLIFATLLSAIANAETQIYLTTAYFVPDAQLLAALKGAVGRGVDVKLLLPDVTDSALVFYASRSFYTELLRAGVKIYERQDALLHAKTAVIDGVWSTIGSTNLDWRSLLHNQEINAVILGPEFGAQMQAIFAEDLKASHQVTLEQWRKRPIGAHIKEFGARLWARHL
jgi:cardiolipin synthase